MAAIIQNLLSSTDQVLSEEQGIALAKKIRQPMWDWHIYLGYVLVGLFSIRFTLPLFGKMKFQNLFAKNLSAKKRFQKGVYLVFFLCVYIYILHVIFLVF